MGAYWILLIGALVIVLQGALFRRYALKRIAYSRSFKVSACYEGEHFELVETIENRKIVPVPWLRVESQFKAGLRFQGQLNLDISEGQFAQNHKSFFSLMPWTKIVRRHDVTASRRGMYRLGTVSMTSGDLLGTGSAVLSLPLEGKLVVYPEPLDMAEMEMPVQTWMGETLVRRWIVQDPFYLSGVREYREGDSLKDIHWKASARTGELQVHRRDATADSRIVMYLNVEDHEHMWSRSTRPEPVEYGIRLAAGAAAELLSHGMEVGIGSNGMLEEEGGPFPGIPAAGGSEQLSLILEYLAVLQLDRRLSFHEFLEGELVRLEGKYEVLLLTTYMNDRLEDVMAKYRAEGHNVMVHLLEEKASHRKGA
ncbi:DUF58 domain-containing protein [Paenibacillus sp. DMB20]|uniref:DUF58 domain-containing protein n=1 Tax=Paenibacillus sp. DMB20 TaxID=1642570 RepID=UPI00062748E6|nr:DUF58 domain-containing protein [Paenibacillus sp. DMB20]KKO53383.1 hypothetical protein XI25_13875 [Paenibacillus sp. DMB20]